MEAEQAELITIILNVPKIMHHIFRWIHKIRSIDRWMIGAWVETNRRNDEEERHREWLRYRRKRKYFFCLITHITNTGTNVVDFCVYLRKQGVEGRDPIMFRLLSIIIITNKILYDVTCTFRIMIRPIFKRSPWMKWKQCQHLNIF